MISFSPLHNPVFLSADLLHKNLCIVLYVDLWNVFQPLFHLYFLSCYFPWQIPVLIFDPAKGVRPKKVLSVQSVAWDRGWGPVGALGNSDYISKAFSCNSCVPLIKILRNTSPHVLLCTETARTLFSWIKERHANCSKGCHKCPHSQRICRDTGWYGSDRRRTSAGGVEGLQGGCFPLPCYTLSTCNSAWHIVGVP